MNKPLLNEEQLGLYVIWQTHRNQIELELLKIEQAIRDDADQIEESAESVYEAIASLKQLIPDLKILARTLDANEWRRTLDSIPR